MSWPMSQDFNEAIQNPKIVFNEPDLRDGEPVIGAHGLPLPQREVTVVLGEQVNPIVVEFTALNRDRHKLRLVWVPPGGAAEEPGPAECLFHDKKFDSLITP